MIHHHSHHHSHHYQGVAHTHHTSPDGQWVWVQDSQIVSLLSGIGDQPQIPPLATVATQTPIQDTYFFTSSSPVDNTPITQQSFSVATNSADESPHLTAENVVQQPTTTTVVDTPKEEKKPSRVARQKNSKATTRKSSRKKGTASKTGEKKDNECEKKKNSRFIRVGDTKKTVDMPYVSEAEKPMLAPPEHKCSNCTTRYTPMWRRIAGEFYCNKCALFYFRTGTHRPIDMGTNKNSKRRHRPQSSQKIKSTATSGRKRRTRSSVSKEKNKKQEEHEEFDSQAQSTTNINSEELSAKRPKIASKEERLVNTRSEPPEEIKTDDIHEQSNGPLVVTDSAATAMDLSYPVLLTPLDTNIHSQGLWPTDFASLSNDSLDDMSLASSSCDSGFSTGPSSPNDSMYTISPAISSSEFSLVESSHLEPEDPLHWDRLLNLLL